jgi:hypothetical protein
VITKEQVQGLFEHTRDLLRDGEIDWDIDGSCLWSYFFVDTSKERLQQAAEHLARQGYEVMGILEPEPGDDDQETLRLQVDKVEKHSVNSLMSRNIEFYALARKLQLRDYDGMECGAVDLTDEEEP